MKREVECHFMLNNWFIYKYAFARNAFDLCYSQTKYNYLKYVLKVFVVIMICEK